MPSWRFDLRIEVDLLEELARVYGYNRLPITKIRADLEIPARPESKLGLRAIRRLLSARDYHEAVCFSFVDEALQSAVDPEVEPLRLSNPISSDLSVMRSSLMSGLLRAAQHNLNRQQSRVRLFETGLRFRPSAEGLQQTSGIGLLVTGSVVTEQWGVPGRAVDFHDLKGDVESLLSLTDAADSFACSRPSHTRHCTPGRVRASCATPPRWAGSVRCTRRCRSVWGIDQQVFLAELDLSAVLEREVPAFSRVSRFPAVRRDLAVIVDAALPVSELLANVRAAAGVYLRDLTLFDVYKGKGIDPNRKSVALGLTFQDQSRTLDDQEINEILQQVIDSLQEKNDAELRG